MGFLPSKEDCSLSGLVSLLEGFTQYSCPDNKKNANYFFVCRYDPEHICNGSDNTGRYAYNKQPEICKWNLGKLAEALVPELPLEISELILEEEYDAEFEKHYLQKMRKKLGLTRLELEEDNKLVSELLETMHLTGW